MEATEVEGGRNVSIAPELSPSLADAEDHFRVKRRALEAVLENCKRALELLEKPYVDLDPAGDEAAEAQPMGEVEGSLPRFESGGDFEADELCALLKSRVESPDFLEKLEHIQTSVYQNIHGDDNASWDVVTAKDLWDDKHFDGKDDFDQDDYVLVKQEDIVDGVACFMATYLLSLKQTKELTPNQLQAALCKTFAVKKKKSRLRKAWDGSKVVYNVASWSATAIGYAFSCKEIEVLLSHTNIYLMLITEVLIGNGPTGPGSVGPFRHHL